MGSCHKSGSPEQSRIMSNVCSLERLQRRPIETLRLRGKYSPQAPLHQPSHTTLILKASIKEGVIRLITEAMPQLNCKGKDECGALYKTGLIFSLEETAKPWLLGNLWGRTKHAGVVTGIYGKAVHWVSRMQYLTWWACKPSSRSSVYS